MKGCQENFRSLVVAICKSFPEITFHHVHCRANRILSRPRETPATLLGGFPDSRQVWMLGCLPEAPLELQIGTARMTLVTLAFCFV